MKATIAKGQSDNQVKALSRSQSNSGMHVQAKPVDTRNSQRPSLFNTLQKTPERIQRYAFVGGVQVNKNDRKLNPGQKAMASDALVRDYVDDAEFKNHAGGSTDYIGNLPARSPEAGVWVRFSKNDMNIVGEDHTHVDFPQTAEAVGTTNLVYEPFSSDDMTYAPNMKKAYMTENDKFFKEAGLTPLPDMKKYGGESLYPKIGFALTIGVPMFTAAGVVGLKAPNYIGKPMQRYVKIAWAYAKDLQMHALILAFTGGSLTAKGKKALAAYVKHHAVLDAFLTGLVPHGYLGDELSKPAHSAKIAPLKEFAEAFLELMVEFAANEPSSRLSAADRAKMKAGPITNREKMKVFSEWRDHIIEDVVKAAKARGVRYGGYGNAHVDELKRRGMPAGTKPFNMTKDPGSDLNKFKTRTAALKAIAVP